MTPARSASRSFGRAACGAALGGAVALAALAGCSSSPAPLDAPPVADAPGGADAPASERDAPVTADAPRPDDAPAADDGGPGAASVAWLTVAEPVTIDADIGLDYFYQYEVVIDGDPLPYALTLERCTTIAGMAETCTSEPRSALPGTSGVRWGIDPSMYAVGENRYRFTLTLDRGGTVVDTDVIELVATVTSCTACVGS